MVRKVVSPASSSVRIEVLCLLRLKRLSNIEIVVLIEREKIGIWRESKLVKGYIRMSYTIT